MSGQIAQDKLTSEQLAAVNSTIIHIGVPSDLSKAEEWLKDGGKLIVFTLEWEDETIMEKHQWSIPSKVEWWKWRDDLKLKQHLFARLDHFVGAKIATLPESEKHKAPLAKFTDILRSIIELSNFDSRSAVFLQKDNIPTINSLKNFRWVEDGLSMDTIKDTSKGIPCYIVAAGPSLNEAIPHLKKIHMGAKPHLIICAGRSYKLLAGYGIMPNYVMEVEMFEWDHKIWTFAPKPDPNCILTFPLCVDPEVVRDWPCYKLALLDLNMQVLLKSKNGFKGGNSILHWMQNLAVYLGCDPITLVGVDLGYPEGSRDTHADGTFHPWPADIQRTEHGWQEELWLTSNDGKPMRSSPAYQNFATLAEIVIAGSGRKWRNSSAHGLKLAGCEVVDLAKDVEETPGPAGGGVERIPASPEA